MVTQSGDNGVTNDSRTVTIPTTRSKTLTVGWYGLGYAVGESCGGGPVGEPFVDDMARPADRVLAQSHGLGKGSVRAPSTQGSSADADSVEYLGHAQHGLGGDRR